VRPNVLAHDVTRMVDNVPNILARDITRMVEDGSPAESVNLATVQLESELSALAIGQLDSEQVVFEDNSEH